MKVLIVSEAALLPHDRRFRRGPTPGQERLFNVLGGALICAMTLGWLVSIADEYLPYVVKE